MAAPDADALRPSASLPPALRRPAPRRRQTACAACGEAAALKCARCRTVYCSRECQRADWAAHRKLCEQASTIKRAQPRSVVDAQGQDQQSAVDAQGQDQQSAVDAQSQDIEDLYLLAECVASWRRDAVQCGCGACAALCSSTQPGAYDPAAVKRLVAAGRLKYEDLVADYYAGSDGLHLYLRPRMAGEAGGELAAWDVDAAGLAGGRACANLGPRGCTLPRDEMPLGCVAALPCDPARHVNADKSAAPRIWGGSEGAEVVDAHATAARALNPSAILDVQDLIPEVVAFATRMRAAARFCIASVYTEYKSTKNR
jgi:hypothetical protein